MPQGKGRVNDFGKYGNILKNYCSSQAITDRNLRLAIIVEKASE